MQVLEEHTILTTPNRLITCKVGVKLISTGRSEISVPDLKGQKDEVFKIEEGFYSEAHFSVFVDQNLEGLGRLTSSF